MKINGNLFSYPVEYKVIVKPEAVEEKTAGGIIIAEQTKSKMQSEELRATLVLVGGNAFKDWDGDKPKQGDTVLIGKYAGSVVVINDVEYRHLYDKDIVAILREPTEELKELLSKLNKQEV